MDCDVCIIGGGPAGLSAALVLGRCRRRVVVIDDGQPRNARASHLHGFLTRDCIAPGEFARLAREDLKPYLVTLRSELANGVERVGSGFRTSLQSGGHIESRKLLLATGVRDLLPDLPGLTECYGISVHHCPYCDAWEHRGKSLVACGAGKAATGLALALRTWSDRVWACCHGEDLPSDDRERALGNGIRIRTQRITRLECANGRLLRVHFEEGESLACDALFFNTGQVQRSTLAKSLGCKMKPDGGILTDGRQCSGVRGLYVAGDAEKEMQFVIVAAAEGSIAAVAMNQELQDEERR